MYGKLTRILEDRAAAAAEKMRTDAESLAAVHSQSMAVAKRAGNDGAAKRESVKAPGKSAAQRSKRLTWGEFASTVDRASSAWFNDVKQHLRANKKDCRQIKHFPLTLIEEQGIRKPLRKVLQPEAVPVSQKRAVASILLTVSDPMLLAELAYLSKVRCPLWIFRHAES